MGRIFIPMINHVVNNQTSIKRWLPARIIQLLLGYHTYLWQFQQILCKFIQQILRTIRIIRCIYETRVPHIPYLPDNLITKVLLFILFNLLVIGRGKSLSTPFLNLPIPPLFIRLSK